MDAVSTPSALAAQLAAQIAEIIRHEGLPRGTHLAERRLAERLRVSRSPIRSALRLLESEGVVEASGSGGYHVCLSDPTVSKVSDIPGGDDLHYQLIADDRLEGRLPDRVTERDLSRRYGLTRTEVLRVLQRIAAEGWIERLPGHGWAFLPMLTSLESYRASYRFRLTIEPAAILEDTFVLDRKAIEDCRSQQVRLIEGDIWSVSPATLFDFNSHLHETIIQCSHNQFFIEALQRIDRLRRLIEYRQALDRKYAIIRCREHVRLADLLLAGEHETASDLMRLHLRSVSLDKTGSKLSRTSIPSTSVDSPLETVKPVGSEYQTSRARRRSAPARP